MKVKFGLGFKAAVGTILTILLLLVVNLQLVFSADLVNRYTFETDASDSVGGAHGSLRGNAIINEGSVVLNGTSAYVDLPNGLVSTRSNISLEIWVTDEGSGTWARILDFGFSTGGEDRPATGTNYLFITPQNGAGILRAAITVGTSGNEQVVDSWGRLPLGTMTHVVLTIDSTNRTGRLYVNGVLVGENTSMTFNPAMLGQTVNNWLGRSQWSGDPFFKGRIHEFRIYDGALSPDEIQLNNQYGPNICLLDGPVTIISQPTNCTTTELTSATFSLRFSGRRPVYLQWYRNGVPIPGATNTTLVVPNVALTNDNDLFYACLTNVYGGQTHWTVSSNAVLKVIPDTNGPTLLRALSVFPNGVLIYFSEGLRPQDATNPANYQVIGPSGPISVLSASFHQSNSIVLLQTSTQTEGTTYTLVVSNVRDLAAAANPIIPGSSIEFIASPFMMTPIEMPITTGQFIPIPNGFEISGPGTGIGRTNDQVLFTWVNVTNDFDLQVCINHLDMGSVWTRAGLMARPTLNLSESFAATVATPGQAGCHFIWRTAPTSPYEMSGYFPPNFPYTWLRLKRSGNVFSGYASIDGSNWEYLGSATIAMPPVVKVGFLVSADNTNGYVKARFINLTNSSGTIVTNLVLPFEPPGPSSRRTPLVISEIMYHPPSTWPGGEELEFIEIWNSGLVTEDLTGHKITGSINFEFPAGTKLPPGHFLVIAKNPTLAASYYGVQCLGPYSGNLPNSAGTVRLLNEVGGILLEVEYESTYPWPVAPDGTGHSLVLRRPSYGENDPRAWGQSTFIGGSPGKFDAFAVAPENGVLINEFLANTDPPTEDFIELFNSRTNAVDLSGAWLTDNPEQLKFQFPAGTVIPPRGFLVVPRSQLGFGLSAAGDSIFLFNSNRTRVLDAVAFGGQSKNISCGRYPDGAPRFYELSLPTPGDTNSTPLQRPVVINEIMYNPISGNDDDEYLELYNLGTEPINLAGWQIEGGIRFTFPSNAIIWPDSYIVVAKNYTNLLSKYPQLNVTNLFGNYSGKLGNSSDRVILTMPEYEISTNNAGLPVTNVVYVVVDDVTYHDGGRWGIWSDGWGSSLELIDPRADNSLGMNWADSDESAKAPWTYIDVTDLLENGQTPSMINQGSYFGAPRRFEFFLQGPGEALVDNLEFRNNGGPNLIANGDFESGSSGWNWGGVVRRSYIEQGVGVNNSSALHLVAVARGDTGPNKVWTPLTATVVTNPPNTGTIRAAVRWLRGSPYILFRLQGHWMEVAAKMAVPTNCGTPGLPNSRRVINAGPAIYDVTHTPVLPSAGQNVIVTARISDPDGVANAFLRLRIDPNTNYITLAMRDDGLGPDAAPNDGVYSVAIGARPQNTLAAFYIVAVDKLTKTNTFPVNPPNRECLVRWGETILPGSLGTYRLWLTSSNVNFWSTREKNANDPIDATFVYNNCRVIYNVNTLYSGSPFHTPSYDGPTGSFACDYEVNFPTDEKFLGSEAFVLTAFDVTSGNFFHNDTTTQIDLTGNWIARKLGQPYNYRRHVHVIVNGLRRGTIYDDAQQPNSEMLDQYFPNDQDGQLRKIEDWFEFADDAQTHGITTATITRYNKTSGEIDTKRYRWNWRPRATRTPDNWTPFTNLIAAVNATNSPNYYKLVSTWVDIPNFLRPIVTHHICGDWDSYGYSRGKNMYAYKPDNQPWRLLMWDIELALGARSDPPNASIYVIHDPTLAWMITNTPAIHREYLNAYHEAVNYILDPNVYGPILDERYRNLIMNGVNVSPPTSIKMYLAQRKAYLTTVLPTAEFSLTTPTNVTLSESNVVLISGTAPLGVQYVSVNGIKYTPEWQTITNWSIYVPVPAGTNTLQISALDRHGNQIPDTIRTITVTNNLQEIDPEGWVVFNEIMYNPPAPHAGFIEIFNRHTNFAFDLTGWRINELNYTFPAGTVLLPQQYLTLAENPFVFNQTYGISYVPFDTLPNPIPTNGAILTLSRPIQNSTNYAVVDRIKYEPIPPWPIPTNSASLQLIDPSADNSRVANWAADTWPPIPPPATLLLLDLHATWKYMQISNLDNVAWQSLECNDANWPIGQGLLAFENNQTLNPLIKTTLLDPRIPTNGMSGGHAYYFRKQIVLTNSLADYVVYATAYVDDGAVFYLNGSELTRIRMNPGQVINSTLANSTPPGGDATTPDVFLIPGQAFRIGTNVLAASVHQAAQNSSDIVFGLSLLAVLTNQVVYSPYPCTPSQPNSVQSSLPPFPPIWLNEIQVQNITGPSDNYNERDPWVELINIGNTNISLAGLYLSDTLTNLLKWPFPTNLVIPPNGFLVIWCDGQTNQSTPTNVHANFRLAPTNGILFLTRIMNGTTQVLDYIKYANIPINWSYGSIPDGQPFYRQNLFRPTPGTTNDPTPPPVRIFINEWMADNKTTLADPIDGNFEDWFELWNDGETDVDLGGFYLTDDLNNPFKFQIPTSGQYVIPKGGFLLVWADGENNQNSPATPDLHVNFALSKSGEAIGLYAPDGTPIDVIVFGPQITDVSQGRFPDGSANLYFMPPTPKSPNMLSNSPPTITPIPVQYIILGQTFTLHVLASDPDVPPQTLTYSLEPGAPDGMTINPTTGLITWTPSTPFTTNTITVAVNDNGTPPLKATSTFQIIVVPPPSLHVQILSPNTLTIQWVGYPGQKFIVETTDNLSTGSWLPITDIISGTGNPISVPINIDPDFNTRFFRVRVLAP